MEGMPPKIFRTGATKGPPQWRPVEATPAKVEAVAPSPPTFEVSIVSNFSDDDLGPPPSDNIGQTAPTFSMPSIPSTPATPKWGSSASSSKGKGSTHGAGPYDAFKGSFGLDSKGLPKGGFDSMSGMMEQMMSFYWKSKGEKGGGKDSFWQDKGKGKKSRGPSGPNLERKRITEEPVTGEVAEWKGRFGWIKPTIPIEHESARAFHKGNIYVSINDLTGGITALTVGSLCEFHVFYDASGLGAEEVVGS